MIAGELSRSPPSHFSSETNLISLWLFYRIPDGVKYYRKHRTPPSDASWACSGERDEMKRYGKGHIERDEMVYDEKWPVVADNDRGALSASNFCSCDSKCLLVFISLHFSSMSLCRASQFHFRFSFINVVVVRMHILVACIIVMRSLLQAEQGQEELAAQVVEEHNDAEQQRVLGLGPMTIVKKSRSGPRSSFLCVSHVLCMFVFSEFRSSARCCFVASFFLVSFCVCVCLLDFPPSFLFGFVFFRFLGAALLRSIPWSPFSCLLCTHPSGQRRSDLSSMFLHEGRCLHETWTCWLHSVEVRTWRDPRGGGMMNGRTCWCWTRWQEWQEGLICPLRVSVSPWGPVLAPNLNALASFFRSKTLSARERERRGMREARRMLVSIFFPCQNPIFAEMRRESSVNHLKNAMSSFRADFE